MNFSAKIINTLESKLIRLSGVLLEVRAKLLPKNKKVIRKHEQKHDNGHQTPKKMAVDIEKLSILEQHKNALDATALVSETDAKGRIIYANKKFLEISGYCEAEILGNDHRIINSSYHPKEFFAGLWKNISKSKIWRGDIRNKRKDGSFYWVDSTIVPIVNLEGKIIKYVSIRFDITQKKEQEHQLKELGEAKSKFLAVMSHEIRTPLGAVIGLSELLALTKLNTEQREYLNDIGKSADLLMNILNDILDLAKLNSGKLEINAEPTLVKDLFNNCLHVFKEKAIENKVNLSLELHKSCPDILSLDSLRLKQIIMNLLSNSIKFTKVGFIKIIVEYCHSQKTLNFCVKDSGIGMTQDQIASAFSEFEQADSGTTKKYGGTGLGLPICERLVRCMNGTIKTKSKQNHGTDIPISIPSLIENSHINTSQDHKALDLEFLNRDIKILMAEDHALNQKVFSKVIKRLGFSSKIVENGLYAVKEANSLPYDIIFLDIQMPIMDGCEACIKIREIEKQTNRPIWLVAITANAFRDDVERYKEIGFDDFVPKPFNRQLIKNAFNNYLTKSKFKNCKACLTNWN